MTEFDTYHHGVRVVEVTTGARAIRTVSTAVIGIVATASDANAGAFPANTAVLITDLDAAIALAGVQGTLSKVLTIIGKHVQPVLVVVRVLDTGDAAAKLAAVKAGIATLTAAGAALNVTPRIIGAPGLDHTDVSLPEDLADAAAELGGFAYARAVGANSTALLAYRENYDHRELMLIDGDFTNGGVTEWGVAHALGLRARLDNDEGFYRCISNVPVPGVTGVSRPCNETEANLLNEAGVTVLRHRNGAFRFHGVRTCSDDDVFVFESDTRTAQVLKDTVREGVERFSDKPLHPSLAKDIIETLKAKGREFKRAGALIGCDFWLAENPSDQLALGRLRIDYDYTAVPPLEDLGLRQRKTDTYFADFTLVG